MSGTTDLRSEHLGVGKMLAVMNAMAARARAGERVPADEISHVIEFLRIFVDQCHHTKEEQLLFPAMKAANVASADAVIHGLLADHAHGREGVTRVAAAAARAAADEKAATAELAGAMTDYTALLSAHILREETDCFDAADRELPAPMQAELNEGYERIEREVVGEGRHEAFHALIDQLSLAYLR